MQEPHHHRDDGGWSAFEPLEKDGGCDDGGAGEEYVVGRSDEGSVEDIQSFLFLLISKAIVK